MVKRTITITTILLILSIAISLIIVLNKSSFAADDDIASGTSGTCSWVIDANGMMTIRPTNGVSGTLENHPSGYNYNIFSRYQNDITKIVIMPGVKTNSQCNWLLGSLPNCTEMDLHNLDVSGSYNLNSMFRRCYKLEKINVTGWNVTNAKDVSYMFANCHALKDIIGIETWQLQNVTNTDGLFSSCIVLESVDISNFNMHNVTNARLMFSSCPKLKSITIGENFNFICNISNEENLVTFPTYASKWVRSDREYGPYTPVELRENYTPEMAGTWEWDVKPVAVFTEDGKLYFIRTAREYTLTDGVGEVQSISGSIFTGQVFTVNESNTIWGSGYGPFRAIESQVKSVEFVDEIKPKCTDLWFNDFSKCTEMNLTKLDTSECVTMNKMFQGCASITSLDVTGFNTSNVTSMYGMFMDCYKLANLDVSGFDTSKVTSMYQMFDNCYVLTNIDVSGFDTTKVINMSHMFSGCYRIKSLDLSSFDTSKVTRIESMFFNNVDLSTVILGENFKFNGKNITTIGWWAYLSTPSGEGVTGKWIREDKAYGPYTPIELSNNYTPEMAGAWVWEKEIKYNVKYSYIGKVPNGASELPAEGTYKQGDEVTVAPNASAPGYTFSGWSRTGTFEMPAQDVVITGSFTPRTDTPYKVEYYLEDLKADTYTLKKTDNLTGTTDTEVTAEEREYEGFTFDSSINGTKLSGNIAGDGSLVLKLYYKRNSYNVTYAYTGDIPDDASALPQQETYEYEEEVNVPEDSTAYGYTFSGWIKDYINMPAKDIEITGYFIENPKSYRYKVEYFFDGELDDTLDEILNAEKDEEISITPQTPLKHGEKNYTLVSSNHKITISVNDEDNVIRVYYETDVLDYAIDNFEDESAGDGISDKYQIRITYKVENGSWNDGTKNNKVNVITLYDKDGNPSENGTGNTKIPEVGSKPNKGYTYGYWNKNVPSKVTKNDDGKEYRYSYETIKTIEADIAGGKGKLSNPKTDDIVNKYLLVGIGGVLVLALVSKIRRKYSRKAKKIQY